MRNLLAALLVIGAVSFAASAQTPAPQHGLKTGYIAFTYTGEILPGQMDNFRQVATKVIAAVAQEPGTLMYEWNLRPDQKPFDVVDLDRDFQRRGRARQPCPARVRQGVGASAKGGAACRLRLAGCTGQAGFGAVQSLVAIKEIRSPVFAKRQDER